MLFDLGCFHSTIGEIVHQMLDLLSHASFQAHVRVEWFLGLHWTLTFLRIVLGVLTISQQLLQFIISINLTFIQLCFSLYGVYVIYIVGKDRLKNISHARLFCPKRKIDGSRYCTFALT